jgi:hypothetical protein
VRKEIQQCTVRLLKALIAAVKAQAAAVGKEPSHLVEELLWLALATKEDLSHAPQADALEALINGVENQ